MGTKITKPKMMYKASEGSMKNPSKYKDQAGPELAKIAPEHKPSMGEKSPQGPYKTPTSGEQSMAPQHKPMGLPTATAPTGVSTPNKGQSMKLPKSGGLGDTEV